jgi:hypothetical protein
MNEKPILFSADMVRAILNGRKTQTRRIIKSKYELSDFHTAHEIGPGEVILWSNNGISKEFTKANYQPGEGIKCPYGILGDTLWVRETYGLTPDYPDHVVALRYRADGHEYNDIRWKPSIFMPRSASRISLLITDVRAERLQSITEEDAIAEGIEDLYAGQGLSEGTHAWRKYDVTKKQLKEPGGHWNTVADSAIDSYKSLWNSINGPGAWDANPWVWVITFEKTDQ